KRWQGLRIKARPLNQMFLGDQKVVRVFCGKEHGETQGIRSKVQVLHLADTHPQDDLIRLDPDPSRRKEYLGWLLKEWKVTKDRGHRRLSLETGSNPVEDVGIDFIRFLWLDVEDDKFAQAEALPQTFLVQLAFRGVEADLLVPKVGNPLVVSFLQKLW